MNQSAEIFLRRLLFPHWMEIMAGILIGTSLILISHK
ncbi:hypothetical protein NSIN_40039 [Nitrosotalea sinensis]|uniref:Uncharacterized protein n=1 Tax=Nitrosotalea sinensis TaxID=1499975 RepID=A0A2H1EJ30_9ARCH|nr:hypothetical protein NSIN_40039 [Candidatus Nitrosotalea sinensis]